MMSLFPSFPLQEATGDKTDKTPVTTPGLTGGAIAGARYLLRVLFAQYFCAIVLPILLMLLPPLLLLLEQGRFQSYTNYEGPSP